MASVLGLGKTANNLLVKSTSEDKGFYLTFVERPNGSSRTLASTTITVNPGQDLIGVTSQNTLALKTPVTIGGTLFDGSGNITPANATRATRADSLTNVRTIGGVSFDGTGNIDLAGVNAAGNQNTSGNAATASALQTARNIGGVSFNGTGDINLPGVNTSGNQNTSGNAQGISAIFSDIIKGKIEYDDTNDLFNIFTAGNSFPSMKIHGTELKCMKTSATDEVFIVNSSNANFHEMALLKSTIRLKLTVDSTGSSIQSETTSGVEKKLDLQAAGGVVNIKDGTSITNFCDVNGNLSVTGDSAMGGVMSVVQGLSVGKTSNPNYNLDVLYVVPDDGTYSPYPPGASTSPVFSTGTTSAVFQTTVNGGKHGVAIGGDVMTGNGFIQSAFNDTSFGFNLLLQPSAGNVGIGMTTSPTKKLQIGSNSAGKPTSQFWDVVSDTRIKLDIRLFTEQECFQKVRQLSIKKFKYTPKYLELTREHDRDYIGMIADEVQQFMPCCVKTEKLEFKDGTTIDDCKSIDGGELQHLVNGSVKFLIDKIEALEAQVNDLTIKYTTLLQSVIPSHANVQPSQ